MYPFTHKDFEESEIKTIHTVKNHNIFDFLSTEFFFHLYRLMCFKYQMEKQRQMVSKKKIVPP